MPHHPAISFTLFFLFFIYYLISKILVENTCFVLRIASALMPSPLLGRIQVLTKLGQCLITESFCWLHLNDKLFHEVRD